MICIGARGTARTLRDRCICDALLGVPAESARVPGRPTPTCFEEHVTFARPDIGCIVRHNACL